MVYLIAQRTISGYNLKVGYTANIFKRLIPYATHNPDAELIETIETYKKTKHQLETEIKEELKKQGVQFKIAKTTGTKTEWFFLPKKQAERFLEKGLRQFKCCQNRKINKAEL